MGWVFEVMVLLDMLEVAPLEEFIVATLPWEEFIWEELKPLEEFIEGFIFAVNEKLDTEASPTAHHTLLRTLLNLPTHPMNLPTHPMNLPTRPMNLPTLNLPTLLTRPTLLKLPTLPNLPMNRPTPTTPYHPSVVVNMKLMLEATELLPDLFEPLPTHRPLHRPWLLWKRDMASLGLLELLLLNKKWDMDSLGLGLPTLPPPTTPSLPTLPPPTTLGLPTLPPPTLLRLPTRRTTPLLPLPMEFIVANVKLLSMALPTRLVGLL